MISHHDITWRVEREKGLGVVLHAGVVLQSSRVLSPLDNRSAMPPDEYRAREVRALRVQILQHLYGDIALELLKAVTDLQAEVGLNHPGIQQHAERVLDLVAKMQGREKMPTLGGPTP